MSPFLTFRSHGYSVPCVVTLPIIEGNPDYLEWLGNQTRPTR